MLVEVAEYISDNGIGIFDKTGLGGNIFINMLPSSPDICISIYDSGGRQADSKLGYSLLSFQVIVRGDLNPFSSRSKAQLIYDLLHGFTGLFVDNGHWIVSCLGIQSGPTHIGTDDNGRHEYSLNFRLDYKK